MAKSAPKIYCKNQTALMLDRETQEQICEIGTEILMGIVNGSAPGLIVFSIPLKDGTNEVVTSYFPTGDLALEAGLLSIIKEQDILDKIFAAQKILRNKE